MLNLGHLYAAPVRLQRRYESEDARVIYRLTSNSTFETNKASDCRLVQSHRTGGAIRDIVADRSAGQLLNCSRS